MTDAKHLFNPCSTEPHKCCEWINGTICGRVLEDQDHDPSAPQDSTDLNFQRYSNEFDDMCRTRHEMGAEKYGEGTFVELDTLEMALHEIVDLANYARYTFIKLRILQDSLGTDRTTREALPGNETLGKDLPIGFFNPRARNREG